MERIRKEEVYINWYYHQHLLGGGRMRKTTPLPNQISNQAPPDYQTGTKFISYKTILSTGQQEFSVKRQYFPENKNRNSSVARLYFPENKTRIPRLYFPQKEYEFLGYKTLFPRGQYEFTCLYYLR
jgi:hypothetical protein